MCTTWMIDGRILESGQDMVDVFGRKQAEQLNPPIDGQADAGWLEGCLCHVDRDRLNELTGSDYRYDADLGAMVPTR